MGRVPIDVTVMGMRHVHTGRGCLALYPSSGQRDMGTSRNGCNCSSVSGMRVLHGDAGAELDVRPQRLPEESVIAEAGDIRRP
jgi:hypothetical protein